MKLKILAFGISKDIVGSRQLEIEIQAGATTEDLRDFLLEKYPSFQKLATMGIAVNNEYSQEETVLKEADEIALIPPVSGG